MSTEDRSLIGVLDGFETPDTRAWEHTLDITFAITDEMMRQGLSKAELARRMDISRAHLGQLLSADSNFTIKTLAKFECALGVDLISFRAKENTLNAELLQAAKGQQKTYAYFYASLDTAISVEPDVSRIINKVGQDGKGDNSVLPLAA
jgi:transcriptional regulator with XRE-family HTH domain